MTTLMTVLLQAAGGSANGGAGGAGMSFWIMIIAIFAIMYFFMIRPQKKKQKEIEKFRNALHVGQDVVTAGGVHGVIRQMEEATNIVILEIAKDVKIRIDKACLYADSSNVEQPNQKN